MLTSSFNVKMIERFMEETKTNLVSIETEIQIAMATSYFNSAALTASLLLRNLRNSNHASEYSQNVYSGHMDVHLIPPVNLVKTTRRHSRQITENIVIANRKYQRRY
ncbi:hypothetical protein HF086_004896 [Spodoptera exigua]|uniref:Uncharacterized protein n=1 Tax=Spodoptera exigua TaxID=7107 RepID=A0A922SM74_SPOEX|nr:hypothetical protein HF086_004896 [Spodoptera exigua]